jgi:hypothetical protein
MAFAADAVGIAGLSGHGFHYYLLPETKLKRSQTYAWTPCCLFYRSFVCIRSIVEHHPLLLLLPKAQEIHHVKMCLILERKDRKYAVSMLE